MVVAILAMANATYAQVLKQVPAGALAVIKVNNLDAVSKKVADLAGALGLVNLQPELADPLGAALKAMGIKDGVNRSGDMAIVMLDPDLVGGDPSKAVIALFPVTDYKAFIGNFADAKTDGDVTSMQVNGSPTCMANWGGYAAITDSQELIAKKPASTLEVAGLAAKELDGKDIVFYANMKVLRPNILRALEQARTYLGDPFDQAIASTPKVGNFDVVKFSPVLKVAGNQILNAVQELVQDTDAATYGVNLSPEGISSTMIVEFQPDSKIGVNVAQTKNTDASLVAGLPDGRYLMFGGAIADGKKNAQMFSNFVAPIEKAITDLGPDYSTLNDAIAILKTMIAVQDGSTFGLIAPSGMLGQGSIIQGLGIRHGDAKAMIDANHKWYDATNAVVKSLGLDQLQGGTSQTYTSSAKTLDGVSFDEMKTSFNMNPKNPAEAQAKTFITMLYGSDGMSVYMGAINDNTVLYTMGLSDASMSGAIASAKSGEEPLAKTTAVKAVAAQLPTQRVAAVYIPLDVWASTGLLYAKTFGMDMGVKIPDDLPPIGVTGATQGSAVRYDSYVPTQLVQALTSAGMQLYMSFQRQQNPGAANPKPGGGL
jgi:hypothetical protein